MQAGKDEAEKQCCEYTERTLHREGTRANGFAEFVKLNKSSLALQDYDDLKGTL